MKKTMIAGLGILTALACQPAKKAVDDSKLTDISIAAPDSKMFPAGSPEAKIKKIRIDVTPLKREGDRFVCDSQKDTGSEVPYEKAAKRTMSFKILQACSYTFTMRMLGEKPEDIFYEGKTDVSTDQMRGQDSLKIDISLNVTDIGAREGFGALGKKEEATVVSGSSDQSRETQVTLASQLGKDSCNVTHLVTVARDLTRTRDDVRDLRKLSFVSGLRLLKNDENPSFRDVPKSLAEACGPAWASYMVRCEATIGIELKTFKNVIQEKLVKKVTTPAFKLDAIQGIEEAFVLKNDYEQSSAAIELSYCLAKKAQ